MTTYPLHALRTLALHALKLDTANGSEPPVSLETVYETVDRLGAVQIDTLQMVARAQYITLWSRLGTYPRPLFDQLAFDPADRRTFEGWYHAACYVPMHEYRYQLPQQSALRADGHRWYTEWIQKTGNREMSQEILERIRLEGGLRGGDFESDGTRRGSWWNWKPAKMALEHLYSFGDLMIADRINFQRVYDLTERVLPPWVDLTEPTPEERDRFWVERGARALGVSLPRNPGDYTWMRIGKSRPQVQALVREGVLVEIQGETLAGVQTLIVHRDHLEALERAAAGEIRAERTTFLNPFDNFWWAQNRDEVFWGFRQCFEAYVPAAKRLYGYFCLPILHKDRLVGRFDPKLERKTGLLRLKALYLEPGLAPDEELAADVAAALRDFMQFHQATDLVIENSAPGEFGEKISRAL
jgi:uncharacterized protein YcaQ